MTPYRLKTASIPTSARIYDAVPLQQDLNNELEGATITEADQLENPDSQKPQQCYILHPYEGLPPRQTTAPDPSTLMHNGEPLYDSESKSWAPSYLPHILRNPVPASDLESSSSVERPESTQKKQKVSSAPLYPQARKCRSVKMTTSYHGPQGLVTETQDVTYLSKAGADEHRLAGWLNTLAGCLRAHHESGSLEHIERRWTGESSTKAYRVEDTDLQLKPDVALLRPDAFDDAYPAFSWQSLASFLELTSEDFSSRLRLQLTKKAYAIFLAQPGRRFVIALSIANQLLRIHVFDRAGAVHSRGYNIHRFPTFLVSILDVLTTAPPACLGYDPTLSFSTAISRMPRPRAKSYVYINEKEYIIQQLLFHNGMIRGRATLCFVVIDPTDQKQYVIKDTWTRSGRMTTEEDMFSRMKEKGLTYGVPLLAAASTVKIYGQDDSSNLRRPSYLFSQGTGPPEIRIHRRLLLSHVGEPLGQFSCIQELLSVLIDIVDSERLLLYI